MTTTLETERLVLQPMVDADMLDMHAIFSDARAMTFMPSPPHASVAETRAMVERERALDGAMMWAVRLRGQDRVIGQVHFLGETRLPGLGYVMHPDWWGQGIAVEACRAALDWGFAEHGYDRVELWIDERNTRSLRVAQKLGFAMKGRIAQKYRHETAYHFMTVWGMLAADWPGGAAAAASTPHRFFAVEPVLVVRRVAEAVAFYRDRLGFGVDFLYGDPPSHAGVSRGEWTGSMVALQLSQAPPGRQITPSAYLHIRVDTGIDGLYEACRAGNVDIVSAPENKAWGFREFSIRDLDGHLLVFGTQL